MNRYILFFIGMAVWHFSTAQSFGEIPSKWYYKSQSNYGEQNGTFICEVTKKVSFQGKMCSEITRKDYMNWVGVSCNYFSNYIYEEDSMVYYWDEDYNKFTMLYNFNAKPDSAWVIPYLDPWPKDDSVSIYVDSVGYEQFGSSTRKVLYVTWSKSNGGPVQDKIVYGIGLISFIYPMSFLNCDMAWASGLVCFESPTIGYFNSGLRPDCLYTNVGIEEETEKLKVSIYPNPVSDLLHIELKDFSHAHAFKIHDLNGRVVLEPEITEPTIEIDVSGLASGMYFIEFRDHSSLLSKQKFIKK